LFTSKSEPLKLPRKIFVAFIRKALQSRYSLFFLNGFLLACLLYFYMEDSYERQLIKAMADYVSDKAQITGNREEDLLLKSLHLTNYLGKSRSFIFNDKELHGLKSSFIHPVTVDLQTASNACGSYAYILSRILSELNITNRIAQMKVNGKYGGHILVEAKTSKGWVVLDGSYNLLFRKPDGAMASFADVMANWDFYKKQVPADYNFMYSYQGVQYTNWNKIPVLMPMIKNILSVFIGKEEAENYSFRTYLLRKYNLLFKATAIIYLTLVIMMVRRYFNRNRRLFTIYFPVLFHEKDISSVIAGKSATNRI